MSSTINNNSSINSYVSFDMATMTKMIPQFSGLQSEDVTVWKRDVALLLAVWKIQEAAQLKLYITVLREEALSWISEYVDRTVNITLNQFLNALEARFLGKHMISEAFDLLINGKIVKTAEEFIKRLKAGTTLHSKGCMGVSGILQALFPKLPGDARAMLWGAVSNTGNWSEIVSRGEAMAWAAFPKEQLISSMPDRQQFEPMEIVGRIQEKKTRLQGRTFCELHGNCNHTSGTCRALKSLREKGWRKQSSRAAVAENLDFSEEALDDIKSHSKYTIRSSTCHFTNNPFSIKTTIEGVEISTLADTGADLSMISKSLLPSKFEISPSKRKLISITGEPLRTLGEARNVPILINGLQLSLNLLVAKHMNCRNKPIIGVNTIQQYPEILLRVMNQYIDLGISIASL